MAAPIICPDRECRTQNGLLAEECRSCGAAVSRSGEISRIRRPGGAVPSASWETDPVPEIWRTSQPLAPQPQTVSAHDLLRYALLLRAMRDRFEEEDDIVWFDDALFFLRGGYEFFCYLNLSSRLSMRGRIFAGLNHARRPEARLRAWFHRFVEEARARHASSVDVFVAEEINSGSSVHRTINVIKDALSELPHDAPPLQVDFWYYLACTDDSVFKPAAFAMEMRGKRKLRGHGVIVNNVFRLFRGPLLAYDEERYSGLRVLSEGADETERYASIRYRATTFHAVCPVTHDEPFWCAPGENDLDNFVGVLILNLLGVGGQVAYQITQQRLAQQSCLECKGLFAQLRGGNAASVWPDQLL